MNTLPQQKFLIVQSAFIGDAILASSLLENIKLHAPNAEIHLLVRKGNESIYHQHPFLKKVWIWDKKQGKYSNLYQLTLAIRKEKFDYCINLQRFGATGLLTVFSGARNKIGFDKNPFSSLFNYKIPHQIGAGTHEIDRNTALLAPIFGKLSSQKPRLYPSKVDYAALRKLNETPYICIAPTSVWFTKQWPQDKWVKLINNTSNNTQIYLLGAPSDANACTEIITMANHPKLSSLAGKLSLLQSAALMQGALMNYVNDSAPMHLCSALNAPVTVIYCSTVPAFGFGPLSDVQHVIESQEKLSCRPCGLHGFKSCPKAHFNCAVQISDKNVPTF